MKSEDSSGKFQVLLEGNAEPDYCEMRRHCDFSSFEKNAHPRCYRSRCVLAVVGFGLGAESLGGMLGGGTNRMRCDGFDDGQCRWSLG